MTTATISVSCARAVFPAAIASSYIGCSRSAHALSLPSSFLSPPSSSLLKRPRVISTTFPPNQLIGRREEPRDLKTSAASTKITMASAESNVEREGGEGGEGEVVLYSSWYCPYAQRAIICLEEKRVVYRRVEVDLSNKPPELLAVNPRGLVPAIVHNGKSLFESMVVVEYVDEAFPRGSTGIDGLPRGGLMPVHPYDRAIARIWMDFIGKKITATFIKVLQAPDSEQQEKVKSEYLGYLKEVSGAMVEISPNGPFFMGEEFGMVDIALIPFVMRHCALEHFRGLSVPDSPEFARFHAWRRAVLDLPSVKATSFDEDKLIPLYSRFVGKATTAPVSVAAEK